MCKNQRIIYETTPHSTPVRDWRQNPTFRLPKMYHVTFPMRTGFIWIEVLQENPDGTFLGPIIRLDLAVNIIYKCSWQCHTQMLHRCRSDCLCHQENLPKVLGKPNSYPIHVRLWLTCLADQGLGQWIMKHSANVTIAIHKWYTNFISSMIKYLAVRSHI